MKTSRVGRPRVSQCPSIVTSPCLFAVMAMAEAACDDARTVLAWHEMSAGGGE